MNRNELYQAVWSKPVFHVAKQLGMSDRGLAKVCERMAIPTPPRGHWRKVSTGQYPEPIPLPDAGNNQEVDFHGGTGLPATKVVCLDDHSHLETTSAKSSERPDREYALGVDSEADVFARNAAVSCEWERALQLAQSLDRHRSVDRLLAELELLQGNMAGETSFVLTRWLRVLRLQQARLNPIAPLLSEFRTMALGTQRPVWWGVE